MYKALLALVAGLLLVGCSSKDFERNFSVNYTEVKCLEGHIYYFRPAGGIAPKLTDEGKPCPCDSTNIEVVRISK